MIISAFSGRKMSMQIHHKARSILSKLSIPVPLQKFYSSVEWEIDLGSNINPYMGEFSTYPDVHQKLLKDLYLKTILSLNPPSIDQADLSLASDHVLFTAGSMEGIDLLIRTFSEPIKDIICVASPTFSAYEHWAIIHGITVKHIPFLGESFENIDSQKILELNPKLTFICNPNNPTGTLLDPQVIENLCQGLDGFVVVDEAYIEFSSRSSFLFDLHKYKNLIILRTFSKAWGLAGVRCGVLLADPLVLNAIRRVQLPFSISSPSQAKVEECLRFPENIFASWERIKNSRDQFIEELSKLKAVEKIFPSEANFVMIIMKDLNQTLTCLRSYRIHVLDCSSSLPRALRVSLGIESQNELLLQALKEEEG